jgi:hypothetical protein
VARGQNDKSKKSQLLFNGVIHPAGKGFYVGAEFFAILSGRLAMPDAEVLDHDSSGQLKYVRQTSWLAQVLATSTHAEIEKQAVSPASLKKSDEHLAESYASVLKALPEIFSGPQEDIGAVADRVGDLLRSLLIPRPFESDRRSNKTLQWQTYLFSPVVPELTSDETTVKGRGLELSRSQYRGGGAIAYQMLSKGTGDGEATRWSDTNAGLEKLVKPRAGGLFELFNNLRTTSLKKLQAEGSGMVGDSQHAPKPVATLKNFGDTIDTNSAQDFRDAVLNILRLPDTVTNNRKIKYILYLSGFFVARHVLETSSSQLDISTSSAVSLLSFTRNGQIETVSRETRARHSRLIDHGVRKFGGDEKLATSFYNKTMQNLGFIDLRGRYMNYTLKLPLLEALILSTCSQEQLADGISISKLDELFWRKFQFVIGPSSSALAESERSFESFIPPSYFQENLAAFGARLEQLGFLNTYSDATQILKGGF